MNWRNKFILCAMLALAFCGTAACEKARVVTYVVEAAVVPEYALAIGVMTVLGMNNDSQSTPDEIAARKKWYEDHNAQIKRCEGWCAAQPGNCQILLKECPYWVD